MENEKEPKDNKEEPSIKEERIRNITQLYYSKPEIQKALFEFSKDREVVPRYYEGFGRRPDSFQYPGDVFELVKKGATSFHCSEELWQDPLKLSTDLNEKQLNEIRKDWDLLVDIDSRYLDYSKISAKIIISFLRFHGIKNFGLKFSGSKGFHILIPSKSFPKEINRIKTSDMFPTWPRMITKYIIEKTRKQLIEKITELTNQSKYVKDFTAPEKVMPDIILVSPRHLFRMPYSLHEKTALASVVLEPEELENFQPKDAEPMKVKIRDFMPEPKEEEASELLIHAMDWHKENYSEEEISKKSIEFKPVKIDNLSDEYLPPSIQKILQGVKDGRKRALFILINLFRSIDMEKEELEKRIEEWNKKNEIPLKQGYITSQLFWSYRNKIVLPPNYDKDYYKGIGILPTEEEKRYKNPVNYIVKKTFQGQEINKRSNKDTKRKIRD